MLVQGDGADGVSHNAAAGGILDVCYVATDVGLNGGVLEDTVARSVEGAVLQHQVLAVTQQLLARQMAVDKPHVTGVPGQVLAVEHGVIDGNILTLPERVLGHYMGMTDLYVATILENVSRVALQTIDNDVLGKHERIGSTVQLNIMKSQPFDFPEGFVSIVDGDMVQSYVRHLTEKLGGVNDRILHTKVTSVPDGRPGLRRKVTAVYQCPVNMPPRVLTIKLTVNGLHVAALLDGRFTIGDGNVIQPHIAGAKQRTFATILLITYLLADLSHAKVIVFCQIPTFLSLYFTKKFPLWENNKDQQ